MRWTEQIGTCCFSAWMPPHTRCLRALLAGDYGTGGHSQRDIVSWGDRLQMQTLAAIIVTLISYGDEGPVR